MIEIRKASERGHADHGWLKTYHTFSFGGYHHPKYMGFRSLRVINEDRVAPGQGFGEHAHNDMEIVSYVLDGALEHKDSLGNGEVLKPGEFQRISAGTGITHSEFNPSESEPTHFYQIWLLPKSRGIEPSYEQKYFADTELNNALRLVASPDGRNGSLSIHQDTSIYLSKINSGNTISYSIPSGRHAWLQVLRGSLTLNDRTLDTSDGAAISNETELNITASSDGEFMLFDLS